MYYPAAYLSLVLLCIFTPLMVPVRTKRSVSWIRTLVGISLAISTLIAIMPDQIPYSAPFSTYSQGKIAYTSCSRVVSSTTKDCIWKEPVFGEISPEFCEDPYALATISHCYKVAHPEDIDWFLSMCNQDFNISVTQDQFENAHLHYLAEAQPIANSSNCSKCQSVTTPVQLDDEDIVVFKSAYDQFLGNYDRSIYYGWVLESFWSAVLALVCISNWSKYLFPGIYKRCVGRLSNWFRKNISLPATGGFKKTEPQPFAYVLDMLVPTRAETLILGSFSILTTYFLFINIHHVPNNPLFPTLSTELLRSFAVRSSILGSSMMPFLILFGGRNNFMQWITRWDYSTYITFHRWISRVVFLLIAIHATCYALYIWEKKLDYHEAYLGWGLFAILGGFAIMIQGLLVLRRRAYETFLILHIILAAMFVFGAYIHVYDLYCLGYYYVSAIIWIFDRVIRIGRLFSFGFPKADVHLLADETLKVIVPKPENWDVIPGGHAFIHFLNAQSFWQSHPFTYTVPVDSSGSIILYIKVKKGVTSSLYKYLVNHPGKSTKIRVSIEGSYGEKTPAKNYDSAVFVAGGNGIPGIYAEVYDLFKRSNRDSKQKLKLVWVVREYKSLYWFYEELLSLKRTNIETTIFVTQPQSVSCLEEFERRVPHVNLPVELEERFAREGSTYNNESEYLLNTSPRSYGMKETFSESDSPASITPPGREQFSVDRVIDKIRSELSHITFEEGRPSIESIVQQSIKNSTGTTCFVTCGHPIMVDTLRASVVRNIDNPEHKRVDYFEQLQVWA